MWAACVLCEHIAYLVSLFYPSIDSTPEMSANPHAAPRAVLSQLWSELIG